MFKSQFSILLIPMLIVGCTPWKSALSKNGNLQVAVNNAIVDYVNTTSVNQDFEIYHVIITNFEHVIGVSINGDTSKWLIGDVVAGQKRKYFPSKYEIRDGKLFYWSDSTATVTTEMLSIMKKYDILDTIQYPTNFRPDEDGLISEGAVDYYFCKSNYLKYKKKKTKVSIGYNKPPNLSCK